MRKLLFINVSILITLILIFSILQSEAHFTQDCIATSDLETNILHVPCLEFNGSYYWADFRLLSWTPVQLQLMDYDLYYLSDLSIFPSDQSVSGASSTTVTYTIAGGVPPYSVFSDDPTLPPEPSTVATNGGTFSVTVPDGTPATTVTYTVWESAGEEATATLTVEAAGILDISPDSIGMTDGGSFQSLIFSITGGVPGPGYSVSSSNPTIAFNDNGAGGGTAGNGIMDGAEGGTWTVINDGDTFTVTVPANSIPGTGTEVVPVILTARDSASGVDTATINITNDSP
jgi:hypothetical protein